MLKEEFMRTLELANEGALANGKRPSPKTLESSSSINESSKAKKDAELLRRGLRAAQMNYEGAQKVAWEVKHMNPTHLPKGYPSLDEALKREQRAKSDLERMEKLANKTADALDDLSGQYKRYSEYDLAGTQYEVYLDKMLFPVAPSEITVKIKDKNEVIDLASGGEFVFGQKPGLSRISFVVLLPAHEYVWAQYKGGFKPPSYFLQKLEEVKVKGLAVDFAVIRNYDKSLDSDTHMRVRLGEYTIKEDASKLMDDMEISVELIQDNPVLSKEVKFKNGKASLVKSRPAGAGKPKVPCTHTVTPGETLAEISRYYYGDSKYWINIAKANAREKMPRTLKGVKFLRIGKL